jgi:carnitine-CoA ligase
MLTFGKITPSFPKEQWVLGSVLEHQAVHRTDKPFLQWGGNKPLSFSQVNRSVNRLAHGLAGLGVKKHEKVVIFSRNSMDFVLIWFALNKLGAVQAPINSSYKGSFLEHQTNLAGARIMIVDRKLAGVVAASEKHLSGLELIILWSPKGEKSEPKTKFKRIKTMDFRDVLSRKTGNPGIVTRPQDIAGIIFTSGTTGPSKGVLMPHAHNYFMSEQTVHTVKLTETDTYMTGFPFFHANAQLLTIYPCLIVGARCVLYEYFSPSAFVERLHESGATVTNFLGVSMSFVYQQPPTPRDSGHKLNRVFCVPTPTSILPDFRKRFGVKHFVEGFGMTEIGMPILSPLGKKRPAGAAGLLVSDWFDLRIVDPDTDEELPVGEVGEFVVRHKEPWILSAGYFGMPEKTAEAYRNLWFHTGDAGRRDEEGWYYYIDRIKDALRRRGENISSYEVEAPILQHAAVDDCAVIAVPAEEEAGEDEVKVCVVLKNGAELTHEQLMAWCDDRMPHFVVPRYVEFCGDLPKTPTEKIQKAKLRDAAFNDNTWDRVAAGYKLKEEIRRKAKKPRR